MKVLLVSHDAGGAEILSAWYRDNRTMGETLFCLQGPAARVFERDHGVLPQARLELIANFGADDWVLTGTSLESSLEREAIKKAKSNDVRCVSFLDHWDLYSQRFERLVNGQFVLPDEIWVGDRHAMIKAFDAGFSATKLLLKANPYFEYIKRQKSSSFHHQFDLLYVCETIGRKHQESGDSASVYDNEFEIMHNFLSGLAEHSFTGSILVRQHPREARGKYDHILENFDSKLNIKISSDTTLIEDVNNSRAVIGMESMGLVVAVLLGKKVFSYRTGKEWELSLPFEEIIRTNSVRDILNAIQKDNP